ncbi:hypothetical protein [Paenibacillus sp.]|jgi:hypothetical protein|uniref:hypothetical protein n=1 Tax=Paenibacillus sp. TaxID=58172 RepID=UPI00283A9FAF|nr:hypothetical protein [Paenibacillus sp.]
MYIAACAARELVRGLGMQLLGWVLFDRATVVEEHGTITEGWKSAVTQSAVTPGKIA